MFLLLAVLPVFSLTVTALAAEGETDYILRTENEDGTHIYTVPIQALGSGIPWEELYGF